MSERPPTISIASASKVTVQYGDQVVLDMATLSIHEGERVGLVGRNGSGKSTLLRIVAGDFRPDSGEVVHQRDLVISYLPQDFDLDDQATVLENILAGARHIRQMIEDYESLPSETHESARLLDEIARLDGWNLEQRAETLINHLHAPDSSRPTGELSGGERRRVALCRSLLARPGLLILDEPTNHLDAEAIEWLEEFLARYQGTCLFVTHDRYFLDRIASRIVDLAAGRCRSYEGNYTAYLVARAERHAAEEMQEKKRQRFLKRELNWVRRSPSARRTKNKDRLDRYFDTAAEEGPEEELDVEVLIPPAPRLSNRVIEMRDVGAVVGDGRTLFQGLNLNLEEGQRLGIVGRNGLGKSTLIRLMIGAEEPAYGWVKRGPRTEINYVDQDRVTLNEEKAIWEEVGEGSDGVRLGEETISLRSYLRRFLFTEERINMKISCLSGGEKSRVLLAKILKRGGNVIVLDEPTNDLDLGTLRLLEEALAAFKGTVVVVSHDRYFLNRVCTGILAFEGHGTLHYQPGDYDYYLEKRGPRLSADAAGDTRKPGAGERRRRHESEKPRKLKWKEERELEGMEQTIMVAEEEVARLDALFAAPDFYEKHGAEWEKLDAELKEARKKAESLYSRWDELETLRTAAEED